MGILAKQYIEEAVRIRKEYINNLKLILSKQDIIKQYAEEIDKTKDALSDIDLTDEGNKQKVNETLILLEKNIKDINDEINPYQLSIEELKKQSTILYNSIKDKYPTLSDNDIENEILPYIQNIV